MPYERLEPCEGKLSRTVLRGGIDSNANLLPDQIARVLNQGYQADSGILTELHNSLLSLNQGVEVLQTVGGQS